MPLLPFSDASPPTTNASLLTSGTLADARLSSNVPLINAGNSFTAGQTITAAANTSALTASYSVTGANTTPLLSLTGTWNTTGIATGLKLNITDTASAATSKLIDLQVAASSKFNVDKNGTVSCYQLTTNSSQISCGQINIASANTLNWNYDTILARDAANTLAQRNGTNAQLFRIYNTYTDASNYERGFMRWNANFLEIGTEAAGTGTGRYLALVATAQSGGQYITYVQGTSTTAGHGPSFNFVTSTTQASSFSQVYAARVDSVTADLGLRGRLIHIGSNGIGFAGTSSFPALKRSSTTLQVRLADDSAFAPVQGKLTTDTAYAAGTVVMTGYVTLYDSTGTAYRVPCAV